MKGTILVTGGAGYIGTHVIVSLMLNDYNVVVIDNLSTSTRICLDNIEKITGRKPVFYKCDCCNAQTLLMVFDNHTFDGIIHFAAYKAVGESVKVPLMYYNNNIQSLINILNVSKIYGCKNIVFSSSATVYGDADILPVTELTARKPATSPYGNTKQICEDIIFDECKTGNLRSIILRYFNPIGAHPSGLIGELPAGIPNNLVPFITQTAIGIRKELSIFGNDYDTPDGTCLRDYIDVNDLADAHVKAIDRLLSNKGDAYEIFNIGTGKPVSVLELLTTFERVNKIKVNYKFAEKRAGDVPIIYADVTKANKILNWYAVRTLDETLKNAWNWENNIRKGVM